MNEAYVEINGVRTRVQTWGRWIEESKANTNKIIILIPGNPGITGFYEEFAKILHKKSEMPVWCVGHAGHNFPSDSEARIKLPKFEQHKHLYGLEGQINHKVDFFNKYVPKDAKIYLVGHSIGAYMNIEMLNHDTISSQVEKVYLLFPTLERMAETKNGKFLNGFVRQIVGFILFLTWIFAILPSFIANALLYVYMLIADIPWNLHSKNIKDLLKPGILRRVFYLSFEEMDLVKERNNSIIRKYAHKIKLYYGRTDGWAPESFHDQINGDLPNLLDSELTEINHTFVFHHSTDVAQTLANWICTSNL